MASPPRIVLRIALLALTLLTGACSLMPDYPARYLEPPVAPNTSIEPDEVAVEPTSENELLRLLYQQRDEWHGVKYKRGGMSKKGVDCSGFVKQTFASRFGVRLPRDTHAQAKEGVEVARGGLRSGDLVFFRINQRTRHVGIYLEEGKFLHASTSKGVMVSSMEHPYWDSRYWKAVRLDL